MLTICTIGTVLIGFVTCVLAISAALMIHAMSRTDEELENMGVKK